VQTQNKKVSHALLISKLKGKQTTKMKKGRRRFTKKNTTGECSSQMIRRRNGTRRKRKKEIPGRKLVFRGRRIKRSKMGVRLESFRLAPAARRHFVGDES